MERLEKNEMYYVYYLYFKSDGQLAEVGRSKTPETRRRTKQKKHGCQLTMVITEGMPFKDACELETSEIIRLRPPLNKYRGSSAGMYGHHEPKSEAHKAAIKATHVGMLGQKHTEETIKRSSDFEGTQKKLKLK